MKKGVILLSSLAIGLVLIGLGTFYFQKKDHLLLEAGVVGVYQEGFVAVHHATTLQYVSRTGKVIYEGHYVLGNDVDSLTDFVFHDGLAPFPKGGKFGLLNIKGEQVIAANYESLIVITNKLFIATKEGKTFLMNDEEEPLSAFFDAVEVAFDYFIVTKGEQQGLIDQKGQEVLPFQQETLRGVGRNSRATYILREDALLQDQAHIYQIKNSLATIVSVEPFSYFVAVDDSYLYLQKQSGQSIIYDLEKQTTISFPSDYFLLSAFQKDLIAVSDSRGQVGFLNRQGQEVIPLNYGITSETVFDPYGYLVVAKDDGYGLINQQQKELLPCRYLQVLVLDTNVFGVSLQKEKLSLIDNKGNKIGEEVYENIQSTVQPTYFIVKQHGKYGLIDKKGRAVYQPLYDSIIVQEEAIIVKRGAEYLFWFL